MKKIIALIAGLLSLLVLTGQSCSNPVDTAVDSAQDEIAEEIAEEIVEQELEEEFGGEAEVEFGDDDSFEVSTSEGTVAVGVDGVDIPSDFRDDIPVYTPSTVTIAGVVEEDDVHSLNLKTDDSGEDVAAFYEKELENEGWTITENESQSTSGFSATTMQAEKDGYKLNLAITGGIVSTGGETNILVTAGLSN